MRNTRNDQRGFTLMEMLIVVAIIAILIAVAIPTFSSQLEKAREATDQANFRSAYAVAQTCLLTNEGPNGETVADLKSSPSFRPGLSDDPPVPDPNKGEIYYYMMNDGSFMTKKDAESAGLANQAYKIKSDMSKPDVYKGAYWPDGYTKNCCIVMQMSIKGTEITDILTQPMGFVF